MEILTIITNSREDFIDITKEVNQVVKESKIKDGLCVLFCPHTTAALTINENADPSVEKDIINELKRLIGRDKNYLHQEGNSDSHIKTALVGNCLNVIIDKGQLVLGTWQGIYFCEFDGPRQRNVYVKIIGE